MLFSTKQPVLTKKITLKHACLYKHTHMTDQVDKNFRAAWGVVVLTAVGGWMLDLCSHAVGSACDTNINKACHKVDWYSVWFGMKVQVWFSASFFLIFHKLLNHYATAPTARVCRVKCQLRHRTAENCLCRKLSETKWGYCLLQWPLYQLLSAANRFSGGLPFKVKTGLSFRMKVACSGVLVLSTFVAWSGVRVNEHGSSNKLENLEICTHIQRCSPMKGSRYWVSHSMACMEFGILLRLLILWLWLWWYKIQVLPVIGPCSGSQNWNWLASVVWGWCQSDHYCDKNRNWPRWGQTDRYCNNLS